MTRREKDIVLLLGSILDAPFAQPHSWTSELVRRNAVRGEVPAHRKPCPACNGQKVRRVRTVLMPCTECVGAQGKPLGWRMRDPMINEHFQRDIGTIETGVKTTYKTVICDACGGRELGNGYTCRYCRGSGIQEIEVNRWRATRSSYTVEVRAPSSGAIVDAMEARERAGSYDELDAALEELHGRWPRLFRLVRDCFILRQAINGSERMAAERVGLAFLSLRMPETIKVPAGVRRREREMAA